MKLDKYEAINERTSITLKNMERIRLGGGGVMWISGIRTLELLVNMKIKQQTALRTFECACSIVYQPLICILYSNCCSVQWIDVGTNQV